MPSLERLVQISKSIGMTSPSKHPITTHILDTRTGYPASNVEVILECESTGFKTQSITDNDGE